MSFRLTVTPPDGTPVVLDPTITVQVSAYQAMVIVMNADPEIKVAEAESYLVAREFAEKLAKSPRKWEMKHERSGLVFSIDGRE